MVDAGKRHAPERLTRNRVKVAAADGPTTPRSSRRSSAFEAGVKQLGARAKPATGEGPAGMPPDRQ